jgi:dGTPase
MSTLQPQAEGSSSGYSASDRERWVSEGDESSRRPAFTRDRARVLHCGALRRLAGKTQVLVAGVSDIPRTRLTHSLEVAQVSRELGAALGCDADVVDVAGLAHDLGHPPFGHNGEEALNAIAAGCGGFEGNAQTFRILTRLETKVMSGERSAGLNLTRASLDACTKYPWPKRAGVKKFGTYADDRVLLDWVRSGSPNEVPCIEAQVMDWADDVAYSVHDVDDGIQLGLLRPAELRDDAEVFAVARRCIDWYLPEADEQELAAALFRLQELPSWVRSFDGSTRAMVAVKRMTSSLIGRFCIAAEDATRRAYGGRDLTRYSASLVVPKQTRLEVAMMKAVAAHYVMLRPGVEAAYLEQRSLLHEVSQALWVAGERGLEPWLRPAWAEAENDADRMRVIVDQLASLTDTSLVNWHRSLCDLELSQEHEPAGVGYRPFTP